MRKAKLLALVCVLLVANVASFQGVVSIVKRPLLQAERASSSALFSSSPPRRTARRNLKKRRGRRNRGSTVDSPGSSGTVNADENDEVYWQTTEMRPLIKSEAREQGVDYWMDEEELQRYNDSLRRRPREAGQVPDEKLWKEVLSPYRENWIGLFSVGIVVMATIIANFPELLQSPVIRIPDL